MAVRTRDAIDVADTLDLTPGAEIDNAKELMCIIGTDSAFFAGQVASRLVESLRVQKPQSALFPLKVVA